MMPEARQECPEDPHVTEELKESVDLQVRAPVG